MMGIQTAKPFVTFSETGFPEELVKELEQRTGHKVIGNKNSSGTEILDELAEKVKDVKIVKVDIDADSELASEYRVMSVPTLKIFKDGEVKESLVGGRPLEELEAKLMEYQS